MIGGPSLRLPCWCCFSVGATMMERTPSREGSLLRLLPYRDREGNDSSSGLRSHRRRHACPSPRPLCCARQYQGKIFRAERLPRPPSMETLAAAAAAAAAAFVVTLAAAAAPMLPATARMATKRLARAYDPAWGRGGAIAARRSGNSWREVEMMAI